MNTNARLPEPGTLINGCKIVSEIGAGGMGSVFKAFDETLGRHVAIKIMHQVSDDRVGRTRFLREASAIARLDHPSIVKIFSYGEFNGQPFFIMEYVEGWSIRDFIARSCFIHNAGHAIKDLEFSGYLREAAPGTPWFLQDQLTNPLTDEEYPARVRRLMHSAASALAEAHRHEIIHRDIKSSNILISDDTRVKIVDFGLVKQRGDSELTRAEQFMGTLSYAAPEQLMGERGKVTPQTDIYSLGVVMYELVTLTHPIKGEDPAAIVASITQGNLKAPRELNPHISGEFERIILKCLEKKPARRYQNAGKLAEDLLQRKFEPTWFSGFTDMLRGWFLKENHIYDAGSPEPTPSRSDKTPVDPDSPEGVAGRFLQSARRKFFVSFAVIEAIDELRQAFKLNKNNADILFLLCFALNTVAENAEIKRIIENSTAMADSSNEKDRGKYELSRLLFQLRSYEEGRKMAVRLQQLYPDEYDFMFALFFCLESLGNYTEAIKVGENLSRLAPDNNIVAVAQSECYFSVMDFAMAIEVLRKRIDKHPDYHNLRLKVIQALLLSGRYEEATVEAEQVLAKDPMNMLMQYYYGRILACRSELQKAYGAFRIAVGLPGDEGLRAMGYYALYRVMELMNRHETAARHLRQARKIKPQMAFHTGSELMKVIEAELMPGIRDEFNDEPWFATVRKYARMICADSADIRSYTIGNYGSTSVLVLQADGNFSHQVIFSNFNLYDYDELYTQLWLPELARSPFIDENGNILTSVFYRAEGRVAGGTASISLAEPWKSGRGSHICCRLSDGRLTVNNGKKRFVLPDMPQPACRRQAFLIVLPAGCQPQNFSFQPDEMVPYEKTQVLCYFPYLSAGETYKITFDL
ncbi:MAG TPA: serine/threonine-protein kinase [Candidatus Rifleibacterium sp.]|nr:serine/threonine-protein kinase [Candidatus Rifleibacterium sp.]HPT45959.1 serine/threonine-protein kinase [Candidatus Rifleibacterium sp.]